MNYNNIPLVLMVYNRPEQTRRALAAIKAAGVKFLAIHSDGPKGEDESVAEVRDIVESVYWCDTMPIYEEVNIGLKRSYLTMLQFILNNYEAGLFLDDDLLISPGSYEYLCEALHYYKDDERVGCVTGWTNDRLIPSNASFMPYFDGRAESSYFGTYKRCFDGLEEHTALDYVQMCIDKGINTSLYADDILEQATSEGTRDLYMTRFIYKLMSRGQLTMRPPWSMCTQMRTDKNTNVLYYTKETTQELRECPPIPEVFPEPVLNKETSMLWRQYVAYERSMYMLNRFSQI